MNFMTLLNTYVRGNIIHLNTDQIQKIQHGAADCLKILLNYHLLIYDVDHSRAIDYLTLLIDYLGTVKRDNF